MRYIVGDCREILRELPGASVQCCVTSPPYYGLRDYGVAGQIGLEPTPDEYVAEMVAVFREVRRVLREDGTLWLNIGDSYARDAVKGQHAPHQNGPKNTAHKAGVGRSVGIKRRMPKTHKHYGVHMSHCNQGDYEGVCCYGDDLECPALGGEHGDAKPKDLLGIPWLLAFALRADGWYLRSDIIWTKKNPMPESVRDRPTSAHEHVFLLTKAQRYFYDAGAIAEAATYADYSGGSVAQGGFNGTRAEKIGGVQASFRAITETRNARNVWTIATRPYSGAHFATMPPDLAERCIKAGTKPGDTVLDPFGGAGTTGLVADRLSRESVLVDLSENYAAMARTRLMLDRARRELPKAAWSLLG